MWMVSRKCAVAPGRKVTVLELHNRPNWWRVWLNHRAVSPAIHLPGSHDAWTPIATAESWDGGTGVCNGFLYRFDSVSIARAPGGGWQPLTAGSPISGTSTRVRQSTRTASFLAAEGLDALRLLASSGA